MTHGNESVNWLDIKTDDLVRWNAFEHNRVFDVRHHWQDGEWYVAWLLGNDVEGALGWWPGPYGSDIEVGSMGFRKANAFELRGVS